jgi:ketosteroid isomerase-like protein
MRHLNFHMIGDAAFGYDDEADWRLQGIAQQIGLKDVRLNTLDLQVAGDMAYEVGEADLTIATGKAALNFVVVWKKTDGQWRLHRDIWNTKAA